MQCTMHKMGSSYERVRLSVCRVLYCGQTVWAIIWSVGRPRPQKLSDRKWRHQLLPVSSIPPFCNKQLGRITQEGLDIESPNCVRLIITLYVLEQYITMTSLTCFVCAVTWKRLPSDWKWRHSLLAIGSGLPFCKIPFASITQVRFVKCEMGYSTHC